MLTMLIDTVPPVVSFHFGLPSPEALSALRSRGIYLMASATNREEARAIKAAGIDAIVARGLEAGGYCRILDPSPSDGALGIAVLTRLLIRERGIPVIAAGEIMDGPGIAAALDLGAVAALLGTAFVACLESGADAAYRAALVVQAPIIRH